MGTLVRTTGAYREGPSSSDRKAASLSGSEATRIVGYARTKGLHLSHRCTDPPRRRLINSVGRYFEGGRVSFTSGILTPTPRFLLLGSHSVWLHIRQPCMHAVLLLKG